MEKTSQATVSSEADYNDLTSDNDEEDGHDHDSTKDELIDLDTDGINKLNGSDTEKFELYLRR